MKNFVKLSLLAAMAVAPVMADESFGGIGVTIYQIHEGVKVAEVIPGTPAAETKLQAGDVITAVDGVSLQGKDIACHPVQRVLPFLYKLLNARKLFIRLVYLLLRVADVAFVVL